MSVVTDELKDDAKWIRGLAKDIEDAAEDGVGGVERLRRIADDLEMHASLMHSTSLLLEQRAEEYMDNYIRKMLDGSSSRPDSLAITLWLIVRALRSGSSKALLGQGLAGLGVGAAAAFLGNIGKSVESLDPDDPAEADARAFMGSAGDDKE